jgi:tRNA dimethylallyltransferase
VEPILIVLAGPTATGKSTLAVQLAQQLGAEIVNVDSQQVYRGLDIGTGKPTSEERGGVPHHLFDIAEPWEQLDAARFIAAADQSIDEIGRRSKVAILVGGTGLWIRAFLKGLVEAPGQDPEIRGRLKVEAAERGLGVLYERLRAVDPDSAQEIQPTDPVRIIRALEVFEQAGIPLSVLHQQHRAQPPRRVALQLGLDLPREALDERIRRRAAQMFERGLVGETEAVLCEARNRPRVERVMGYREALACIEGRMHLTAAVEATALAQRQYSRRQRTWFKAEPAWRWLDPDRTFDQALAACHDWIRAPAAGGT